MQGVDSNITNEEARYEEQNKEKALQSYFVIGVHADGCYEHTHRAGTCGREKLSILSDQNGKGVTFKVEWDEPKLGEETVFHLSATGGNASNKYYMTSPNYSNPGSTEREMLVDPTYSEWKTIQKSAVPMT